MKKLKKHLRPLLLALVMTAVLTVPAFASGGGGGTGNVGAVVESTWKDAAGQIKTVVNNVVFPALDMSLRCSERPGFRILTTKNMASLSGPDR